MKRTCQDNNMENLIKQIKELANINEAKRVKFIDKIKPHAKTIEDILNYHIKANFAYDKDTPIYTKYDRDQVRSVMVSYDSNAKKKPDKINYRKIKSDIEKVLPGIPAKIIADLNANTRNLYVNIYFKNPFDTLIK